MNRASFLKKALVAGYGLTLLGRVSPIEAAQALPEPDDLIGYLATPEVLPKGWLVCDGSAVRVEDYPDLYALLGDSYGKGPVDGSFRVPDLRVRAIAMQSVSEGPHPWSASVAMPVYGIEPVHEHGLTTAQLPAHTHSLPPHLHGSSPYFGPARWAIKAA